MLDSDYWVGGTSTAWNVDTNWSLRRAPRTTDDALFDASYIQQPCSLPATVIATPQSVTFAPNLDGTMNQAVLTVAGMLQTPAFTINARSNGTNNEIQVASQGVITVTDTLSLLGGNIAGSGEIDVNAPSSGTALVAVTGTTASDPPTLGCRLVLNSTSNCGTTTMNYGGIAAQPLVVTGNASITVNAGATLTYDGVPLPGQTTVTAISNGDAGGERIIIAGGTVQSDGSFTRVVGMGVEMDSYSSSTLTANGSAPLEFSGSCGTSESGLLIYGGFVNVAGKLTIDKSLNTDGGGAIQVSRGATLTLGQNANSAPSEMYLGGAINLSGTLVAHGGFNIDTPDGGGLISFLDLSGTITLDPGTAFTLNSGTFQTSGNCTINGNFTANGGTYTDSYAAGSFGTLNVNGNINLSTSCTFTVPHGTNPPSFTYGPVLSCTGTVTGNFTYNLPTGWSESWNQAGNQLYIEVP